MARTVLCKLTYGGLLGSHENSCKQRKSLVFLSRSHAFFNVNLFIIAQCLLGLVTL